MLEKSNSSTISSSKHTTQLNLSNCTTTNSISISNLIQVAGNIAVDAQLKFWPPSQAVVIASGLKLKAKDVDMEAIWEKIILNFKKELDEEEEQFKPPSSSGVDNSGGCGGAEGIERREKARAKFFVPLSRREMEKDFEDMGERRLPRKPKKRPKIVQNQLDVYLSLCCALVASAVGAYLHILWNIGGLLTTFATLGTMFWLLATPPYQEQKRVSLLMASSLLQGASLGPLIELAIDFDPSILVSAFMGTAIAFACFSGAAMLARRREYLYLGGLLSSGVSILFWLHFASSIFGGSVALFQFELYFWLLVFVGYMVFDTQEIIEKDHLGDLDYVKHALLLFTDFFAVFVRILIIMLKNSAEKEEKKKKRRN